MAEPSMSEIIDRVQADHDVDAEQLLAALVGALAARHVDVELRRLGRRPPYPIHNERADALKAVNDAVHQAHAGVRDRADEEAVLRAVQAVLFEAQFAAERAAGIGGDDDEDDDGRPRMRIARN
jgi:hypothetical protein